MILKAFFAAVVAMSFGALFNVRGRSLLLIGLNGFSGFLIYSIFVYLNFDSYIGMFFASTAMTVFAEAAARLRKTPASLFLIAALIPIVPGGGMFRFMLLLLQNDIHAAGPVAVNTILEAGAIAIGIIIVSSAINITSKNKGDVQQ